METAGLLTGFMNQYPGTLAVADNVGVGAGVVDRLQEQGKNVIGTNVGTKPREEEKFTNLRAEIYWNLRERFINGEISIPYDGELIGQLATLKYKYNSKGLIRIESKDEMVRRGLVSPDCADALPLAFYPAGPGGFVKPADNAPKPVTAGVMGTRF